MSKDRIERKPKRDYAPPISSQGSQGELIRRAGSVVKIPPAAGKCAPDIVGVEIVRYEMV